MQHTLLQKFFLLAIVLFAFSVASIGQADPISDKDMLIATYSDQNQGNLLEVDYGSLLSCDSDSVCTDIFSYFEELPLPQSRSFPAIEAVSNLSPEIDSPAVIDDRTYIDGGPAIWMTRYLTHNIYYRGTRLIRIPIDCFFNRSSCTGVKSWGFPFGVIDLAIDTVNKERLYLLVDGYSGSGKIIYVDISKDGITSQSGPEPDYTEWSSYQHFPAPYRSIEHVPDIAGNDKLLVSTIDREEGISIYMVPHASDGRTVTPFEDDISVIRSNFNPQLSNENITKKYGGSLLYIQKSGQMLVHIHERAQATNVSPFTFESALYLMDPLEPESNILINVSESHHNVFTTSLAEGGRFNFSYDPINVNRILFASMTRSLPEIDPSKFDASLMGTFLLDSPNDSHMALLSTDNRRYGGTFIPALLGGLGTILYRDCAIHSDKLLDLDKDGIPNCMDQCPINPEGENPPLKGSGCPCREPYDSDGDNIQDCFDPEPFVPEGISLDSKALCLEDADNDGASNCVDACPLDSLKSGKFDTQCGCANEEIGSGACTLPCVQDTIDMGCGCNVLDCNEAKDFPFLTQFTRLIESPQLVSRKGKLITLAFRKFSNGLIDVENVTSRKNRRFVPAYKVTISRLLKNGKVKSYKSFTRRKNTISAKLQKKGIYTIRYQMLLKRKRAKRSKYTTDFSPSKTVSVF